MKIAFISTLFGQDHGGCEVLWMNLAAYAKEQGHTVHAYVYEKRNIPSALQALMNAGINVVFRKHGSVPASLPKKVLHVMKRKLASANPYKAIDTFNPDIIYINQAGSVDAANDQNLREYLAETKIPYFINPHHVSELNIKPIPALLPFVQQTFNKARGLIFVSRRNQQVLCSNWKINNTNGFITVNPLNISSFSPMEYPVLNGLAKFATVAFLSCEHKGHDILMDVLGQEKWKEKNWVWNIYGTGPDKEKLSGQAAALGIADRVVFKGFVNDIQDVWRENHIHIFPTLSEGMPIAILESLACGKPVVTTDIGGNKEWIDEGYNGFIADKPTISSVDIALERAWSEKGNWKKMGQRAYERFTIQYNFNYLEDLYNFITAA